MVYGGGGGGISFVHFVLCDYRLLIAETCFKVNCQFGSLETCLDIKR